MELGPERECWRFMGVQQAECPAQASDSWQHVGGLGRRGFQPQEEGTRGQETREGKRATPAPPSQAGAAEL